MPQVLKQPALHALSRPPSPVVAVTAREQGGRTTVNTWRLIPLPQRNPKNGPGSGDPAALPYEILPPGDHRRPPGKSLSIPGFTAHLTLAILTCLSIVAVLAASASAAQQRNYSASPKKSLAVLNVESVSERDQDTATLLTTTIRDEIAKTTAAYSVMEQSRMLELLKEHSFPLLQCSTKECAIRAGRILGVQTAVIGSLGKTGKTTYLSLSRVNIMTGTIEFVVEDKCRGKREELLLTGAQMAHKLMGELAVTLPGSTALENERFVFRELTAFDNELATFWARDADLAGKMTWEEANEYIHQLNKEGYGGYGNWRLPDKTELATVIEYATGKGTRNNINDLFKNAGFRNMKAEYYWSATLPENGSGLAWVLDMYSGEISSAATSNRCYLWPIRTGPWLFDERSTKP